MKRRMEIMNKVIFIIAAAGTLLAAGIAFLVHCERKTNY